MRDIINAIGNNFFGIAVVVTALAYAFILIAPEIVKIVLAFHGCS